MPYKFTLHNRLKFRKVYHFYYISFSGMNEATKLGGISENISKKIGYKFHILIDYRYKVILVGS
jgi:hypothetical protein